jgi:dTDP-4-dehydrorhamnose reductase
MRVAVLGARGLLGRHLVEELRGHEARPFERAACDITQLAQVEAAVEGCDAVVNCAGFTNVDGAEADADGAYRANAIGAENVARAARRFGCKAVHVSTDFVFGGEPKSGAGFDEFDEPRPLSIYGRSKLAGETLARAVGGKLFVVRIQGLYGAGGSNFSSKLRALLLAGKPLKLDAERRVQPTWARPVARQILRLLDSDHFGLYHASCHGEATWAVFARRLCERLGIAASFEEVPTDALKAPAARPRSCLFEHRMLAMRGLDVMPIWQVALDEYLEEEKAR